MKTCEVVEMNPEILLKVIEFVDEIESVDVALFISLLSVLRSFSSFAIDTERRSNSLDMRYANCKVRMSIEVRPSDKFPVQQYFGNRPTARTTRNKSIGLSRYR